jgi:GT2 family glycosyltransferase
MKATVIISNLHPEGALVNCVQSACAQSVRPGEYEVILPGLMNVTREERETLKRLEEDHPQFTVLRTSGNRSEAINAAAAQADGKLLLFLESHCITYVDWVAQHIGFFGRNRNARVARGSIQRLPSASRASMFITELNAGITRSISAQGMEPAFLDLHNTSMTKECFREMGGLAPEFPSMSEFELGARLHQRGIPIVRVPQSTVQHVNPVTLSRYAQVVRNHGFNRGRILVKHGPEFMRTYFPNPKLLALLPSMKWARVPLLCGTWCLMHAGLLGFRLAPKPLTAACGVMATKNALRTGMLQALKEYP